MDKSEKLADDGETSLVIGQKTKNKHDKLLREMLLQNLCIPAKSCSVEKNWDTLTVFLKDKHFTLKGHTNDSVLQTNK